MKNQLRSKRWESNFGLLPVNLKWQKLSTFDSSKTKKERKKTQRKSVSSLSSFFPSLSCEWSLQGSFVTLKSFAPPQLPSSWRWWSQL